ncbi:D-aminoacyl-tRNA deacylase [Thermodesulforhabdus norvegica]|uniref:D-aminoacyl-tRNA deacylase n=1 Tax=Thermodesulforhabdus norvegica TaxID=39841 RepID=A0A1I4VXT5_9BACT|nr:D-aminoacyl-tRNA deacylase [Thermodesulforhabdus norvegica]SFN06118.1 D-tyrosyl-tRNA(Tyr) deacylase [Thermodesulforhabdus norvegica]
MRAVIQRVTEARVTVKGEIVGAIGRGLLILVGVGSDDSEADVSYMAEKLVNLRIFEDATGRMNLSLKDISGDLLVVSQFTLYGDCRKGRRPSFTDAAPPDKARKLYDQLVEALRLQGIKVQTGKFQEHMEVYLVNDGPVTLLIDSKKVF